MEGNVIAGYVGFPGFPTYGVSLCAIDDPTIEPATA